MNEKDEYIEKLSKKNPMLMQRFELEDWLDHCIYDKMQYHSLSDFQKDTFNLLLYYFRLLHFELHQIEAKAENNGFFIKAFLLLLKEKNPDLVDVILKMVEDMTNERSLELVKDESPEDACRIIERSKELAEELKKRR